MCFECSFYRVSCGDWTNFCVNCYVLCIFFIEISHLCLFLVVSDCSPSTTDTTMSLENTNILAAPSGGMDDLDSNFLGGVVFNFGSQYDTSSHSQTPSTDESAHQMSDPEDLATPFPTTPTVSSANKAPSKGTVPVSIRIRPLLSRDYAANVRCCISCHSSSISTFSPGTIEHSHQAQSRIPDIFFTFSPHIILLC